jgi:hypothetical protein
MIDFLTHHESLINNLGVALFLAGLGYVEHQRSQTVSACTAWLIAAYLVQANLIAGAALGAYQPLVSILWFAAVFQLLLTYQAGRASER